MKHEGGNRMTLDRKCILKALEILDWWADRIGAPMSIREGFKDPWRAMLENIEKGVNARPLGQEEEG